MRSVEEVLKNHFGPAKIMDESTDVAAAAASKNKSNGAEASGENRAATLAAAEALASFPTSAASVSTPSGGRSSRDQPPLLFPPAAGSTSASPAWMMKGGISGLKQTVASATKKKTVKYVKDPRAPKRFKSAFIFFTMHRHKTIRKEIEEKEGGPGNGERTPDVAKLISEEWRNMAADERAKWDEKARLDRERYEVEKSMYKGPWKVPASQKSKVKARRTDADAPKRPMSSFLSYSNSKRAALRRANPYLTNGDMSKMLAKMWREAPDEEKREHIEREERLREIYLKDMAAWRERTKKEQNEIREKREEAALRFIDKRDKGIADDSDLKDEEAWGDNYKVGGCDESQQNGDPQHPATTTAEAGSYYAHYPPHAAFSQDHAAAPPPQYYGYYYPAVVPYQYPPQPHVPPPAAEAATDVKSEPREDTAAAAAAPQQPPPYYNPYMYCGPPPPLQENDSREGPPVPALAAPYAGHYYSYYYYGQVPQQPGAPPMPQGQADPTPAVEPMAEEKIKVEKP